MRVKSFAALAAAMTMSGGYVFGANVGIAGSALVGKGIVEFVPERFDSLSTPMLILSHQPVIQPETIRIVHHHPAASGAMHPQRFPVPIQPQENSDVV